MGLIAPQQMRLDMRACTQQHAPECTATCPLHLDVRAANAALAGGNFDEGFALLQKTVWFPRLVSAFCTAPCQKRCAKNRAGQPLAIRALEESLCRYGTAPKPALSPFMQLEKKVALVGGGISGLAAGLFLYEKGFAVTFYEKENRLGGRGWQLDAALAEVDFAFLAALPWQLQLGRQVGGPKWPLSGLLQNYDAVYLSGDARLCGEYTFEAASGQCPQQPKLFAGGSALRAEKEYSIIHSLADGRKAALSIDRFLKGVSLTAGREGEGGYQTELFTFVDEATPKDAQIPQSLAWLGEVQSSPGLPPPPAGRYTKEEAQGEAGRCLQCQCLQCQRQCVYMQHFRSYPYAMIMEMATHIRMIAGQRQGGPLINSCSLCGLCKEICPNRIEMPKSVLTARRTLVQKGQNVAAMQAFPLEEMRFSNGEWAALWRHGPGESQSRYLFYPGCQLAAVLPGLVLPTYRQLLRALGPQVGIALGCCGAPAHWAGYEEEHAGGMEEFARRWQKMGKPQIIAACPTCQVQLMAHLPGVLEEVGDGEGAAKGEELPPVISLWEVLAGQELPEGAQNLAAAPLAVQDACGSRNAPMVQNAVRTLLAKLGCQVQELPYSRDKTKCCNYGGLMNYANPALAKEALHQRLEESERDYLCYCAACREQCQRGGKTTWHLLELLFGEAQPPVLDISQKRENRLLVKREVLRLFGEEAPPQRERGKMLVVSEELRRVLDERLILLEDAEEVVLQAEESGKRLQNPKTGHYIAHWQKGYLTYWVEYSPCEGGFTLHNAYSHRLEIVDD